MCQRANVMALVEMWSIYMTRVWWNADVPVRMVNESPGDRVWNDQITVTPCWSSPHRQHEGPMRKGSQQPAPQIQRASRWHCALYEFSYLDYRAYTYLNRFLQTFDEIELKIFNIKSNFVR